MTLRAYLALLGLVFCVCSLACSSPRACTEIGCLTFVQVELAFESGIDPSEVEVTVRHGDESFVCAPGADQDPCHKGFGSGFFPGQQPEEGNLSVVLNETPEVLELTVVAPTGTETVTVRPRYRREQPNGPDCPPVCHNSWNRVVVGL